ncbi:MAG: hypothetical protein K1000chlam1_00764 [Candidatus Anoxychlamydiales bacterium]|nr:hypothetical protein [Candidatus Anoxychlamydiales bacterium]
MKKIFSLFFIFVFQLLIAETHPFFIAPKNWQVTNPKTYTKYIQIAFTKNETAICRPSLNLSIQETDLTLDEYTKEAQKIHQKDPNTTYTILGNIDLSQGKAKLSQIDQKIYSTNYQLLQMIFIKDNVAYIMTASSKKDDMLKNHQTFLDTFSSFKITHDLFSLVSDKSKQEMLKQKYNSFLTSSKNLSDKQLKKKLSSFEKYLDNNFQNLGKYFQVLLFKKAYKEIKES